MPPPPLFQYPEDNSIARDIKRSAWDGPAQSELREVELLSRWLDSAFKVPLLGWRFGLDPLIGLIPGLGDIFTSLMSLYILSIATRLGVPRVTLGRMTLNVAVDYLLGSIPLVGDAFDFWWKSNRMNVRLLERYLAASPREARRQSARDWLFLIVLALLLVVLLAGSVAAGYFAVRWAADWLKKLL